jgi:hypothetical protein
MKNAAGFSVARVRSVTTGPKRNGSVVRTIANRGEKRAMRTQNPRETANAGEGEAEHADKCPHAAKDENEGNA